MVETIKASLKTWLQFLLSWLSLIILISSPLPRSTCPLLAHYAFQEMVSSVRHCFTPLLPQQGATQPSICVTGICVSKRHQHKHAALWLHKRSWLWTGAWWALGNCSQAMKSQVYSMETGSKPQKWLSQTFVVTSCYVRYQPLSARYGFAQQIALVPHSAIWKTKLALPPQLCRSIILQAYRDFIWGMYKIQS